VKFAGRVDDSSAKFRTISAGLCVGPDLEKLKKNICNFEYDAPKTYPASDFYEIFQNFWAALIGKIDGTQLGPGV